MTTFHQDALPLKESSEIQKLGAYLKKLRQELGLSLRDVAAQGDLSPGYVSKIENGVVKKTIGVETLVTLSQIYQMPVEIILAEAGFNKHNNSEDLPSFAMYLKIKYRLSPQAVRDLEIAKEVVERKYGIKIPRRSEGNRQ